MSATIPLTACSEQLAGKVFVKANEVQKIMCYMPSPRMQNMFQMFPVTKEGLPIRCTNFETCQDLHGTGTRCLRPRWYARAMSCFCVLAVAGPFAWMMYKNPECKWVERDDDGVLICPTIKAECKTIGDLKKGVVKRGRYLKINNHIERAKCFKVLSMPKDGSASVSFKETMAMTCENYDVLVNNAWLLTGKQANFRCMSIHNEDQNLFGVGSAFKAEVVKMATAKPIPSVPSVPKTVSAYKNKARTIKRRKLRESKDQVESDVVDDDDEAEAEAEAEAKDEDGNANESVNVADLPALPIADPIPVPNLQFEDQDQFQVQVQVQEQEHEESAVEEAPLIGYIPPRIHESEWDVDFIADDPVAEEVVPVPAPAQDQVQVQVQEPVLEFQATEDELTASPLARLAIIQDLVYRHHMMHEQFMVTITENISILLESINRQK